jgi:hypothetical protein
VLIYHEPDAPRSVFISILAATSSVTLYTAGWFRKIIELWRIASIVVLFIMAVSLLPARHAQAYTHSLKIPGIIQGTCIKMRVL